MKTVHEKSTSVETGNRRADGLGAKALFRVSGNRVFRIDPLPRGKMADVPLQKSKSGLTGADALDYLREETGRVPGC